MIGRQMNIYTRKPVMLTVTWKANGVVLKEEQVEIGDPATPPTNVSIEGYDFLGWDKDYYRIMNNMVINAKLKIKTYTVRFFMSGILLSTQYVEYDKSANPPTNLTIPEGYIHKGWDKDYTHIKSDTDINAIIDIKRFMVYFYDNSYDAKYKRNVLKTEEVEYGKDATPPTSINTPIEQYKVLSGWIMSSISQYTYREDHKNIKDEMHLYPFITNDWYFADGVYNEVSSYSFTSPVTGAVTQSSYSCFFGDLYKKNVQGATGYDLEYKYFNTELSKLSYDTSYINAEIQNLMYICTVEVLKSGAITLTATIDGITHSTTINGTRLYTKDELIYNVGLNYNIFTDNPTGDDFYKLEQWYGNPLIHIIPLYDESGNFVKNFAGYGESSTPYNSNNLVQIESAENMIVRTEDYYLHADDFADRTHPILLDAIMKPGTFSITFKGTPYFGSPITCKKVINIADKGISSIEYNGNAITELEIPVSQTTTLNYKVKRSVNGSSEQWFDTTQSTWNGKSVKDIVTVGVFAGYSYDPYTQVPRMDIEITSGGIAITPKLTGYALLEIKCNDNSEYTRHVLLIIK
jgi:hypothetical protein